MNILPKKHKVLSMRVTIAFVCAVLIIAAVFYYRNRLQVPYWQDLEISPIHLTGISGDFAVKDGKIFKNGKAINQWTDGKEYDRVLKLSLFFEWMKENPILFASDIDTASVGSSVEKFKTDQDKLVDILSKGSGADDILLNPGGSPIRFQLFPIDFMESFLSSSQQYKIFSQDVSEQNAELLLTSIGKTSDAYYSDVNVIGKGIAKAEGNSANLNELYLHGQTASSPAIINSDFVRIQENAKLLDAEVQKRTKCLDSNSDFCERPILNFPVPVATSKPVENEQILSPEQVGMINNEKFTGPYIVNSQCWGGRNQSAIYDTVKCDPSVGCMENSYLADDSYFYKPNSNNPEDKSLIDQGAKLVLTSSTGSYDCNDLEYKPELNTIDNFYVNYHDKRLFQSILDQNNINKLGSSLAIIKNGVIAENNFFDAKYPSHDELDALSSQYAYAYSFLSKNNLLDNATRQELLTRNLLISEKFANLNFSLNRSLFNLQHYIDNAIKSKKDITTKYLYSARNDYSLLFLNFSSSVWQGGEKPQYLTNQVDKNILSDDLKMLNYSQARAMFSDEQLTAWHKLFVDYKQNEHNQE